MILLGKLTFSILGLRYFGMSGFFWGISLGHLFFDRTIISKLISKKLSSFDDNLRLLLPYRYYLIYDKFMSPIFGKVWGIAVALLTFGWLSIPIFIAIGHICFDMDSNIKIKNNKLKINDIFSAHIFKITGFALGFSLKSKIIVFTGIILGYFIDIIRSKSGLTSIFKVRKFTNFWPRINSLKIFLNSPEAKKSALVKSMAGLSAKLSKADGEINSSEINTFKRLFNITSDDQNIMQIFNDAGQTSKNYEPYAKQIKFITKDNLDLKEDVIENLFKIIIADNNITIEELNILKDVAKIIEIPNGNFEVIRKRYEKISTCNEYKDYYKILGVSHNAGDSEIREVWRKLTTSNHPDMIMANGGSIDDVAESNVRMSEINEAYQQIMKQRK